MTTKLRLTLMVHVEDTEHWDGTTGAAVANSVAKRVALLSTVAGQYGGKVSVQFGRHFVDHSDTWTSNPAFRYSAPSSMKMVLDNGGNFWCHTHDGSYDALCSTYMCVASAVAGELSTAISFGTSHAAGRSAGAEIGDLTLDWVSIAVHAGIRRMNSTVVNYYSTMPESLRPYGMTDRDMDNGVWYHDAAPGPFVTGLTTMRQRPFYINTASVWDEGLTSIFPTESQVGSLLMIPQAGREAFDNYAEGRTNQRISTVTINDFNACLTEIYTTYQNMVTYQNSITNVWYVLIPPDNIKSSEIDTFGVWVQSINAVVGSGGEWRNFNEITSLYTDPQSFNW